MGGFLDKRDRVVDMVLTDYGKELFSVGRLDFVYYAFSDDEVDYDPYIFNSGSLSSTELTASKVEQIEATLVREATTGFRKASDLTGDDTTNINNITFSMPQGQKVLPLMRFNPDVTSGSVKTNQRAIQEVHVKRDQNGNEIDRIGPFDKGHEKFGSSLFMLELKVDDFFDVGSNEGFRVDVFLSASEGGVGLKEIVSKKDRQRVLSYLTDLKIHIDTVIPPLLSKRNPLSLRAVDKSVGIDKRDAGSGFNRGSNR